MPLSSRLFPLRMFGWIVVSFCYAAKCWALPDALFSMVNNILTIPFVAYQGQSYRAEMNFTPPDTLVLKSLTANTEEPEAGRVVPVYADLSMHLSQLRANGENYQADIRWQAENTFKVQTLKPALFKPIANSQVTSPHFSGSGNCQGCHNGLKDDTGKDVSIISAWQPTMMANAARDPFWKAQVRNELLRTPSQAALINERCSRCHAPMANVEAKKQNTFYELFNTGLLQENHRYFALAQEGVSCSLCHQISKNALFGTPAGMSGNFEIDSFANPLERKIYGPFSDILAGPMQQFVQYTPTYSAHIKASEHCGSCHDLKTPYTDAMGKVLSTDKASEFPEQMVYSEWQQSGFANSQSCQQCHMKRSKGVVIAAQVPGLSTKRDDFAQHRIVGGNKLMLTMLQDYSAPLGVNAKDFSAVLLETDELLHAAATLNITQPSLSADTLQFTLQIRSQTGHKLPSAYPSRRLIVHVVVKDPQQAVVFESGKVNADGSVQGLDADSNSASAEPHYTLISAPEQVQVYEDVMEDYQGNLTYTLLRAKRYRKDNRLLPKGFDKFKASSDIQVVGEAYQDADFTAGGDDLQFKLAGFGAKRYSISAELIYQPLGYAFAQDMFLDKAPEIQNFQQMFTASQQKSSAIAQTVVSVERSQ